MNQKILLPTVDLGQGGVARYILSLAKTFKQVRILELPKNISWTRALSILQAKSQHYDQFWVHHIFPLGTAVMLLRLLFGLNYTIFLHGLDFDLARRNKVRSWVAKAILKLATHVVTNSKALAREVKMFSGVEPVVVYPTASDELIAAEREKISVVPHPVTLLTVGRLVVRKGQAKVLQALKNLPGVNYLIVGSGPERESIETLISDLGLIDRVQILADISDHDLPDIYRRADIFVMPTTKTTQDREGFGIVYLEAALFGLPVVATRQPGVDEAVIDGQTGILVEDKISDLTSALKKLIDDPSGRQRLGQAGHERVLREFTRDGQLAKINDWVTAPDCEDGSCGFHHHETAGPLVSVVVPTYQHAATLSRCLDSILSQTYQNIELIVVNDGSTDATPQVLEAYQEVTKIIHQDNQGANPARNRGLQAATGEFVIFCDADVRMKPEMIECLLETLEKHPEASYAYSAFRFGWKRFGGVPFSPERLRERNFIHTTCLVRRSDFPGFDERIKRLQDWDVWLTMLEQGKQGTLVPAELFTVAVSGNSRIGSSWLPSFMYRIPWQRLPWRPQVINRYEAARSIIEQKHGLI